MVPDLHEPHQCPVHVGAKRLAQFLAGDAGALPPTNSSTLCATVGIGVLYTATQWRRTGRRRWLIDQGNGL